MTEELSLEKKQFNSEPTDSRLQVTKRPLLTKFIKENNKRQV